MAILLTRELNLRKVVIKGDSKICIDTINRAPKEEMPIFVSWEAVSIVEDSCEMAKELDSLDFSWINHEANMAAHCLTK